MVRNTGRMAIKSIKFIMLNIEEQLFVFPTNANRNFYPKKNLNFLGQQRNRTTYSSVKKPTAR